jgi:hypothetical protein
LEAVDFGLGEAAERLDISRPRASQRREWPWPSR